MNALLNGGDGDEGCRRVFVCHADGVSLSRLHVTAREQCYSRDVHLTDEEIQRFIEAWEKDF